MKDREILREYYENEISGIREVDPSPAVWEEVKKPFFPPLKYRLENVFGCIFTAGYLLFLIAPDRWFSFGRVLFSFRFGFLF